jgi:hypothetical protein
MSNNLNNLDDLEEWENIALDDFIIPFKETNLNDVQKQDQSKELKQLEERKLVEEADTALSKELFCLENKILNIESIAETKPIIEYEPIVEAKIKINKQKQNENKQKELSKKIKEQKMKQKRHNELYGEVKGDYMYDEYNDKFNK